MMLGVALAASEGCEPKSCYDFSWSNADGELTPKTFFCTSPRPCPRVEANTNPECDGLPAYDAAVGACILDSLRAGETATHVITTGCAVCPIQFLTIQVEEQGILWDARDLCDLEYSIHETWRSRPPSAYFDACDADTIEGLMECLNGILDQPCPEEGVPCSIQSD